MTKGKLEYIINGVSITLTDNDAILIPPGSVRKRTATFEQTKYTSFNFTLSKSTSLIDKMYMPNILTDEIKKIITASNIKRLVPSPLYREKEKLCCLLSYILLEFQNILEFESKNKHVISITKYINQHITEKISLAEVSKAVNLSKEYTANIFKKETGQTVNEYINERKLILAKEMIASRNISLFEASQSVGYDNYSYFSRIFKKRFGTSPKEFKN